MKTKAQQKAATSKKILVDRRHHLDAYKSTLGNMIEHLQDQLKDHRFDPSTRLELRVGYEYGDDTIEFYLTYEEEETDQEFKSRMESEARQEEWQKRQYEELKKKFG